MTDATEHRDEVVSFDDESLICVDEQDREIGFLDKAAAHDGDGVLHRAFSLFIFNPAGELLLQQRAAGKRLWPGFWSNTCCSHPRRGETLHAATHRRLQEELGFDCPLNFLYQFIYHARYGTAGSEHELCHVFVGTSAAQPRINRSEIEALRWCTPDALDEEMARQPDAFTPWFQLEWQRVRALNPAESGGAPACPRDAPATPRRNGGSSR